MDVFCRWYYKEHLCKTQIRKAYTNLKKFHLKVDNRIRFILEKCRLIVTIHLGKRIIYNADTQPVSGRVLARMLNWLRGEKSQGLQYDTIEKQTSTSSWCIHCQLNFTEWKQKALTPNTNQPGPLSTYLLTFPSFNVCKHRHQINNFRFCTV